MKLTKKKSIVLLLVFLASLFPMFIAFVYFVPLNVVWISADKELESHLKIYLYQGTEMTVSQYRQYRQEHHKSCCYDRRELFNGEGSIFLFREEYGEHRFLMKHDSAYGVCGFFKFRAWYDMFIRFHFYKSDDKVYCDVSQWSWFHPFFFMPDHYYKGFHHEKGTICLDGDVSLKKKLDDYACEDD